MMAKLKLAEDRMWFFFLPEQELQDILEDPARVVKAKEKNQSKATLNLKMPINILVQYDLPRPGGYLAQGEIGTNLITLRAPRQDVNPAPKSIEDYLALDNQMITIRLVEEDAKGGIAYLHLDLRDEKGKGDIASLTNLVRAPWALGPFLTEQRQYFDLGVENMEKGNARPNFADGTALKAENIKITVATHPVILFQKAPPAPAVRTKAMPMSALTATTAATTAMRGPDGTCAKASGFYIRDGVQVAIEAGVSTAIPWKSAPSNSV